MRNIPYHYAVLGAALLLSACASGGKRVSSGLESPPVSLTVTRQTWQDVHDCAIRGSARYRLGAGGGTSSATLRIPSSLVAHGDLRLMADPIGSNDVYVRDVFPLAPEQRVLLTVAPRMRLSTNAIWKR